MGMIAMVRGGLKNRIQVKSGYAQVLQLIQVLGNPDQVAAFEAMQCWRRFPRLEVSWLGDRFAAGKAVGEDLVEDGMLDPIGGCE